ncbi:hypothetical protein TpMuguga_05g00018 (apicoplast) [Theileria parva strain Muguga]|uniref:Ribosomal protein S7, putative n=1 Tax=Theileria parva TaxID=5875 RepID=Q4MYA5_THEPA|nr:hypothetical protein TpMuguga_05g00018 [Theileria parva strain Muguga]|eukprot:XP_762687.1 ribosomal protein S7 (apicoplast) [Theileria parva strain Muguga]
MVLKKLKRKNVENSAKKAVQYYNPFILNLLLNCINKNGKKNVCKNLVFNSSINIIKNNCFVEYFENLVLKPILPFKIISEKNKSKYIYTSAYKSISNLILNVCKFIRKHKKKVSFDFYFKNEINKLLNKNSNLHTLKKQFKVIFKNTSTINKKNIKKKSEKNLSINIIKLKKISMKYFNNYFTYHFLNYNSNNEHSFYSKKIFNTQSLIIKKNIKKLKYLKTI